MLFPLLCFYILFRFPSVSLPFHINSSTLKIDKIPMGRSPGYPNFVQVFIIVQVIYSFISTVLVFERLNISCFSFCLLNVIYR